MNTPTQFQIRLFYIFPAVPNSEERGEGMRRGREAFRRDQACLVYYARRVVGHERVEPFMVDSAV